MQERYKRASNSAKLVEVTGQALGLVSGEAAGVMNRVRELQRLVIEIEKNDPAAREWTSGLETAVVELEDLGRGLEHYLGEIDIDPQQAAALEERVDVLENLKRKYGPSLEEVVESGARAAASATPASRMPRRRPSRSSAKSGARAWSPRPSTTC